MLIILESYCDSCHLVHKITFHSLLAGYAEVGKGTFIAPQV